MDSAEVEQLSKILRTQEARLNRQEEFQTAMAANMGHLSSQLKELMGQLIQPSTTAPTTPSPPETPRHTGGPACKLAPPTPYTGEPGLCKTFLIDCSIHFELLPHAFPTERSKVAFMISHLTGRAKAWASAEWGRGSKICDTLTGFQGALTKTFDPVSSSREKAQELSHLKQGKDSVCDYAIYFRTLAAESGWNNTALYDVFLKGLAPAIQDLLVPLDLPTDLDALIALTIRTDNRRLQLYQQRETKQKIPGGVTTTPDLRWPTAHRSPPDAQPHLHAAPQDEAMQLGRAQLTPEEHQRWQQEGRCFYCGGVDHLVAGDESNPGFKACTLHTHKD